MLHQTHLHSHFPSSSSSSSSSMVVEKGGTTTTTTTTTTMKNIVKGGLTPKMILDDVSSHLSPLLFHHSCVGGAVDADDFFVDQLLNLNNVVVDETQPLETVIVPQQQQQQQQQVSEDKDASFLSSPLDTAEEADLEWLSHFVDDSSCPYSTPFPPGYARLDHTPEPEPKLKPARPPFSLKRARKRNRVWARPSSSSSLGQGKGKGQSQQKRCSHCGAHKTPQWRVGPDGERTLCNACGVRYKSGRLLPEYRPACSPNFSSALHSNNHKKVMEMRMIKYNMNKEEEKVLF